MWTAGADDLAGDDEEADETDLAGMMRRDSTGITTKVEKHAQSE